MEIRFTSRSRDFKYKIRSVNGLLVEDGKIVRPLAQITVAGNLYTLLKDIVAIGNDTKFSYPSFNYFGSPSIYIRSLTISG